MGMSKTGPKVSVPRRGHPMKMISSPCPPLGNVDCLLHIKSRGMWHYCTLPSSGGLPWLAFTISPVYDGVCNMCTTTWACGWTLCSAISPDCEWEAECLFVSMCPLQWTCNLSRLIVGYVHHQWPRWALNWKKWVKENGWFWISSLTCSLSSGFLVNPCVVSSLPHRLLVWFLNKSFYFPLHFLSACVWVPTANKSS